MIPYGFTLILLYKILYVVLNKCIKSISYITASVSSIIICTL